MPKFGDVRADGMIYRGTQKTKNGRVYEQWLSPEAWEARRVRQSSWSKKQREKIKQDPGALAESREYARLHMLASRRRNIVGHMLTRARARAKARGLEFGLTHDDVEIPERCPVLGIQLRVGDGTATDNSPELDRIDNSKGYVRGNVVVVSRRANRIKNDSTVAELRLVLDFYERLLVSMKPGQ